LILGLGVSTHSLQDAVTDERAHSPDYSRKSVMLTRAVVQWYAFDAIGAITFSQRLGFMEQREDVADMIAQLDFGFLYGGHIGRVPWTHKLLLGNVTLAKLIDRFAPNVPDPVKTAIKVSTSD
jgi:hypothetical protein